MPVHDWTRVDAGTFHAFHTAWITHLSEGLNGGVLPSGYYALPEQHFGHFVANVLALQTPSPPASSPGDGDGGLAVAEFVEKAKAALECGINILLVDLFPPGPFTPQGMHGAIWERFDDEPYLLPANEPLTVASYRGGPWPKARIVHLVLGATLPEMPVFLNPDRYVNVPLEETYMAAERGLPGFWREVLDGKSKMS